MTTITIPTIYLAAGEPLFNLGLEALVKGANPYYDSTNTYYPIESQFIDPATANQILAFPGTKIENYFIQRYLAVSDLATELPVELPQSSNEDGEQLTWQDVQDLSTVNISPINGVYHMNVTAHLSHRGLTLDEFNACVSLTLLQVSDIPKPTETPE